MCKELKSTNGIINGIYYYYYLSVVQTIVYSLGVQNGCIKKAASLDRNEREGKNKCKVLKW